MAAMILCLWYLEYNIFGGSERWGSERGERLTGRGRGSERGEGQ